MKNFAAQLDTRYRGALMTFFLRRARSHAEAEDLTQDVFLRLIGRRLSADVISDGYIFTIAANLLRDRARRDRVRRTGNGVALDSLGEPEICDALTEDRSPERVLLSKDELARVLRVLDELGQRTRDIFLLYRFEGMKQREIAQLFEISVSAVEKQLVKALAALANELGRND